MYESFSHGLIKSKLWLCEKLETTLDNENIKNPAINILASWDSLLAFMLLTRRPNFYGVVNTYDIDTNAVYDANKICNHWLYEYPKIYNHTKDIYTLDFTNTGKESIFINCSVDQMLNHEWYNCIPDERLVCLQSTNLPIGLPEWEIKQSYETIAELTETYKVRRLIYADSLLVDYGHFKYYRHMMIGIK